MRKCGCGCGERIEPAASQRIYLNDECRRRAKKRRYRARAKARTGVHSPSSQDEGRLMHPSWVRSLRDQCAEAGVPFHFKQWGEWAPRGADGFGGEVALVDTVPRRRVSADNGGDAQLLENASLDDHWMQRIGKSAAGRLLGGVEHNGFPVPS